MPDTNSERRKYYRINDVVQLRYEVISDTDDTESHAARPLEMDAGSLLEEIDRELNESVNLAWKEHPTIARALGLLNRKISVIASLIDEDSDDSPLNYSETMVNISGCGIAFESDEPLALGTRLRIYIVLLPSGVSLTLLGRVIGAEQRQGDDNSMHHWVRADFEEDPHAQEQLIQHVVQRQGALLAEDRY